MPAFCPKLLSGDSITSELVLKLNMMDEFKGRSKLIVEKREGCVKTDC